MPKITTARSPSIIAGMGAAIAALVLAVSCGPASAPTPTSPPAGQTPQATPTRALTLTPTPTPAPKRGGSLRVSVSTNPTALDSLQSTTNADLDFLHPVYDALIRVAPDQSWQPMLARSWEVGTDGKSIVLKLVQGAKFHDGTPFNAAAVKDHLDYARNPDNKFEQRAVLTPITSIEVVDEYTVRLNLQALDALVLPNLGARPGQILSPTARKGMSKADLKTKAVGAGCFKQVEFVSDSHMSVERWNACFSQQFPYLDRVQLQVITDPAVAQAAFRAKDLDIIGAGVDPDALPTLRSLTGVTIDKKNNLDIAFFALNPRVKPLDDVRVRRVLSMAVDRQALILGFEAGNGTVVYGPNGPAWPWVYDPNFKKYAYDPAGAKKLLAEAGYANGLTLGPVVWYGKEGRQPLMSLLADQMRQVGVTLQLQMIESAQASREFRIDKKYAAYSSGWSGPVDVDRVFRDWFHSKGSSYMYAGYMDAAVQGQIDQAIDGGRSTIDPLQRRKSYLQAQDLIVENMLWLSLYQGQWFTPMWDYVKGYDPFPENGFQNWFQVWLQK